MGDKAPLGAWLSTAEDPSGLTAFDAELDALVGRRSPAESIAHQVMDTIVFTERHPSHQDIEFMSRWMHMAAEAIEVLREGVRRMEGRIDEAVSDGQITIEEAHVFKRGELP